MARTSDTPVLSPNNLIYLYRLLSEQIGVGKQTFLPAVEEALASDRMTADDLGFESTRALLEALDAFIKLTVFKGGRIYATVIAQPAWDEALAALVAGKQSQADSASKSNKPWKRKKADKTLKPVRPKRVKRPEPEPEPAPEPKAVVEPAPEPEPEPAAEPSPAIEGPRDPDAAVESRSNHENLADSPSESTAARELAEEATLTDERAPEGDSAPEVVTEPSPAISLTVTYDPYSGIDRETKLVSHPVITPAPERRDQRESAPAVTPVTPAPAAGPSQTAAATAPKPMKPSAMPAAVPAQAEGDIAPAQPSPTQTSSAQPEAPIGDTLPAPAQPEPACSEPTRPEPLAPEILASYPEDFSTDVYLASDRIAELCELLPYGTDVFALLAEDYARARTLQLITGTRARATFPLRIQHADSIEPIRISLKKRSGTGLQWELSAVE